MLGNAVQNRNLAGATGSLPAGGQHVAARSIDSVQDGFVNGNRKFPAGSGENDGQWSIGAVLGGPGCEPLDNHVLLSASTSGRVLQTGEQRFRTTGVDIPVTWQIRPDRAQVEPSPLLTRPSPNARTIAAHQLLKVRHPVVATRKVEELPVGVAPARLLNHWQDRRDADPSCDEQVGGGLTQREMIPRAADAEPISDGDLVMDGLRATASGGFAQHRDAQFRRGGVPAQRVLPQRTVGEFQVDVRARLPLSADLPDRRQRV